MEEPQKIKDKLMETLKRVAEIIQTTTKKGEEIREKEREKSKPKEIKT
jgi:F0F1-type ATP synthase membrane subunit b/b'